MYVTINDKYKILVSELASFDYEPIIKLIFDANSITSLPELPDTLTYLDCSNNRISTILVLPPNLKTLHVANCNLSVLPTLPNDLRVLVANNNLLVELPTLPLGLRYIDVNDNKLVSLPTLPKSLVTLYVENNKLTTITGLPIGLRLLDASNNELTIVPNMNTELRYLYLSDNNIGTTVPNFGVINNQLTTLAIDNNTNLVHIPKLPDSLMHLRASGCAIESITGFSTSTQTVSLNNNKLKIIPALPDGVISLSLTDNLIGITWVSQAEQDSFIETLPSSLANLSLERNVFRYELTNLDRFADMTYLNLKSNEITSINNLPPKLEVLTISDNSQLKTMVTTLPISLVNIRANNVNLQTYPELHDKVEWVNIKRLEE